MTSKLVRPRLKGLIYRCQHRGVKELDLLLGGFAQKYLSDFTDSQLVLFENLLDCPENDLLDWVTGVAPAPEEYATNVLEKIRTFVLTLYEE
ncbi:MAG: succinate dehydrogenase assembly factor 2 [Pseudomonadota bacterium]